MSRGYTDMDDLYKAGNWTAGRNGSHWDGCEDVHWDCRIIKLTNENEDLQRIIEELESHWIPVETALPEASNGLYKYDYVLLYWCEDYGMGFYGNPEENPNAPLGFYQCLPDGYDQLITGVTHWMPLPKPPEVE